MTARSSGPASLFQGDADMVREPPGEELRAALDEAVDAHDPADARQAKALPVEEDRDDHPDQRIDGFSPSLAW